MYSLQNYTTYSIKSGLMKPEEWAERAGDLGYEALAITDKQTMAGTIEFQKACDKAGVKPILGEEFLMTGDVTERDKKKKADLQGVILLYAKDETGLKNLITLNNFSTNKSKGYYYYPRLDPQIIEKHSEGLVCVIPAEDGYGRDLQTKAARLKVPGRLAEMGSIFGDDFYIGLNPMSESEEVELMNRAVTKTLGDSVKYVFTFNAHCPEEGQSHLYEIVRRIDKTSGGHTLSCQDREVSNGFLPTAEELEAAIETNCGYLSTQVDAAKAGAAEIIEKCGARIELGNYHMPEMETETGSVKGDILKAIGEGFKAKLFPSIEFEGDYLKSLDELEGWKDDLTEFFAYEHVSKGEAFIASSEDPEHLHPDEYKRVFDIEEDLYTMEEEEFIGKLRTLDQYVDRLKYEFKIIEELGYFEYFHLVAYICNYIDEKGLGRGFARGSAAGSIVSYLMNITRVDPMRHGLLFERFLNPDRNDLPDIDLDFSVEAREEIKRHVREKWGEQKVCNIGAYGRLKVVSAIKKVAASDGYAIPDNSGEHIQYSYSKLTDILKNTKAPATARGEKELRLRLNSSDDFQKFYNRHEDWIESVVVPLQDMVVNTQIHAAGTLITRAPLDHCVPVYEHSNGTQVTQWQDRACEEAGNPKFDFLTVEGVNVAEFASKLVSDRRGIDIPPIEDIPLDDQRTMDVFTNVDTEGIFQFRTPSQREFFNILRPTKFEELVAAVALIRPGPMSANAHLEYAAIKHGKRDPNYEHEDLIPILEDTYGLIIYQEQVMEIAKKIAGFTGAEADYLRKAAGKKKLKKMMKWEELFLERGQERGYELDLLDGLWEKIVAFSEYGFNKCITGDTVLQRAGANQHTGKYLTVSDLYEAQGSDTSWGRKIRDGRQRILQYCPDGRIRPGHVVQVHKNGVKPVFEMELESGKKIKATENHRFLTDEGYVEIQDLNVGDNVITIGESVGYKRRGRQTKRARGKNYDTESPGFVEGSGNPSYIDGRQVKFKETCEKVKARSNRCCEFCGKVENDNRRFEVAHIKSLDSFDFNYIKYHDLSNVKYLCNSCHKKFDYEKGERVPAWSKGKPSKIDRVKSITYVGDEMTYDVEMADPYHNFIANGIVSHNSHAVAYTLLSYYQAYIKARYKVEFWPAVLKYSSSTKDVGSPQALKSLVKDLGIKIVYPTLYGYAPDFEPVGNSDEIDAIYWPLRAIKGIGDSAIEEMCGGGRRSFSSIEEMMEETDARRIHKGIFTKLIKAGFFDCIDEPWEVAKQYFELRGKGEDVPDELSHRNQFKWHLARNEVYDMVVKSWKEVAPFHKSVMSKEEVESRSIGKTVFIGGYIESVRVYRTKFGNLYARLKVTDEGESYTVMMWGGFYGMSSLNGRDDNGRFKRPWEGQVVEIAGKKDEYNGYPQVVLNGRSGTYLRIIWDEFDQVFEDAGKLEE